MSKLVEKITIRRGINHGEKFCDILCDGKIVDHALSRKLTGTTQEHGSGVFAQGIDEISFEYGKMRKEFSVKELNFSIDDPEVISEEIQNRIDVVRAWVAGIDRSEEFSFFVTGGQ